MTRQFGLLMFCFFILANSVNIFATTNLEHNRNRVLKTCQCAGCNLQSVNLTNFKPGANAAEDNPFVSLQNSTGSACWLKCDFKNADFSRANLSNANFTTCIRGYTTPSQKINFSSAKLVSANLSKSILIGVNFQNANLSKSNLSQSRIFLSKLNRANLSYANLYKVISLPDAMHGWGTDFSQANFSHANLTRANLYGNFQSANFSYAKFKQTTLLSSSDVKGTQRLSAANLWKGVNFSHTNLKGLTIKNIDGKLDLSKAIFCQTIMPNGTVNNRNC